MNTRTIDPTPLNARLRSALAGGWVADAASLGLHWLYDSDRIHEVAGSCPEFLLPDVNNFQGVFGFFAHSGKSVGDTSHYAAGTHVLTKSLLGNHGHLVVRDYQRRFRDYFGPGGGWQGYIDNPTRVTLDNLQLNEKRAIEQVQAETTGLSADQQRILVQKVLPYTRRLTGDQLQDPVRSAIALTYDDKKIQEAGVFLAETIDRSIQAECGANDLQLPAVSKLPPLIACYTGRPELKARVEAAVRVTNHNDEAVAWADCIAVLLDIIYQGRPLQEALDLAQERAPEPQTLLSARNMSQLDAESAGDQFGRTCYLGEAVPVIFHILAHAQSFTEAIRANIFCGGDSCGRAWIIGPVLAAIHGVGRERGIPLSWLARVSNAHLILDDIESLRSAE